MELPKFTRSATELTTACERWSYFLRHGDELDAEAGDGVLHAVLAVEQIDQTIAGAVRPSREGDVDGSGLRRRGREAQREEPECGDEQAEEAHADEAL